MTELETKLLNALTGLTKHVESLESRLQGMTKNYGILSKGLEALEKQVLGTGEMHRILTSQLESSQSSQTVLLQQLDMLQKLLKR